MYRINSFTIIIIAMLFLTFSCQTTKFTRTCIDGEYDIVKEMLISGEVDIQAINEALFEIVKDEEMDNKKLTIIGLLIEHNADINYTNMHGKTLLMNAVLSDNIDLVTNLIVKGADVNAVTFDSNMTSLMFAAKNAKVNSVTVLLANGADHTIEALFKQKDEVTKSKAINMVYNKYFYWANDAISFGLTENVQQQLDNALIIINILSKLEDENYVHDNLLNSEEIVKSDEDYVLKSKRIKKISGNFPTIATKDLYIHVSTVNLKIGQAPFTVIYPDYREVILKEFYQIIERVKGFYDYDIVIIKDLNTDSDTINNKIIFDLDYQSFKMDKTYGKGEAVVTVYNSDNPQDILFTGLMKLELAPMSWSDVNIDYLFRASGSAIVDSIIFTIK